MRKRRKRGGEGGKKGRQAGVPYEEGREGSIRGLKVPPQGGATYGPSEGTSAEKHFILFYSCLGLLPSPSLLSSVPLPLRPARTEETRGGEREAEASAKY